MIESSRARPSGELEEIKAGRLDHWWGGASVTKTAPVEGRVNPNYRWAVLGVSVVAQATFLGAVFQGLHVLGPVLRSAYGLSLGQLGLVLSSVAVGVLATLLALGAAADRFGERRVMVLGLLGAAVALLVGPGRRTSLGSGLLSWWPGPAGRA